MDDRATARRPRSALSWLAKLAVSAVLVAIVASRLDVAEIGRTLERGSPPLFALALALLLAGQVLTAVRWRLLLVRVAHRASRVGYLTELVLIGSFFNFFLPSTVGGDVLRAELLSVRIGSRRHAYLSTLLDRFSAMVAVLAIGAVAGAVAYLVVGWFDPAIVGIAVLFAVPTAVMVAAIRTNVLVDALRRAGVADRGPLGARAVSVAETLREYGDDGRVLVNVLVASLAVQVVGNIAVVACLARAMSIDAPLWFHAIAVPIVILVTLLPFSLNGIGIREGAFALLYARVGVGAEEAVALSAAWTLLLVVSSLLGGVLLVVPGRHPWRRAALERAQAEALAPDERPA